MLCARVLISLDALYDRLLPARLSSLTPIEGILLKRLFDFVDEVGDDV
jgi:hypothetical protein